MTRIPQSRHPPSTVSSNRRVQYGCSSTSHLFGQPPLMWRNTLLRTGSVRVAAATCLDVTGNFSICWKLNIAGAFEVNSLQSGYSGNLDKPSALP